MTVAYFVVYKKDNLFFIEKIYFNNIIKLLISFLRLLSLRKLFVKRVFFIKIFFNYKRL